MGSADLLVALYAPGEAGGVLDLLDSGATALAKHFPSERGLTLCLPVGWREESLRSIRAWTDGAPASRLALEPGRYLPAGHALRTLLALAGWLEARAAVIMDATLVGLPPAAIGALLEPVVTGRTDCALPAYSRSAAEGTLTTNVLAPLSRIVYGRSVQQLVGGCAALSSTLMSDLIRDAPVVEGWAAPGTQIWLATRVLMPSQQLVQVHLGRRPRAAAPTGELPALVAETVGPLFTLMERDQEVWREPREAEPVPLVGGPVETLPDPGDANVERMVRALRLGLKDLLPVWEQILPDPTLADLYPLGLMPPEDFRFPPRLWARVVLDFAVAHHERRLPRDHLLRALTPLYLGRVAAFLLEARREGAGERAVEAVARAFEAERPTLIARWR